MNTTKITVFFFIFLISLIVALNFGSSGQLMDYSSDNLSIILEFRLPRVISTALIGAFLATSGCAYQCVFRNPMVSPDLLGSSSGAAFGVVILMMFGYSGILVPVSALFFGLLTTLLCVFCAYSIFRFSVLVLILVGILISSLLASLLNLLHYLLPDTSALFGISYFLMGSLNGLDNDSMLLLLSVGTPAFIGLWLMSSRLDLLALPYDVIQTQGISIKKLVLFVLVLSTICSTVTVCSAGIVGWISLVVPNIVRNVIGGRNSIILPMSALFGASFLLIADTIARSISDVEIPIGVITGIIGAPIFLVIMAMNIPRGH